jgi:hypothetical protein
MTRDDRQHREDRLDAQLRHAAGELRDRGQAPPRDLWPDIDAAITAAERRQLRAGEARPSRWLPWAAAAAMAMIALGGWWTSRQPAVPGGGGPVVASRTTLPPPGSPAPADELTAIDAALDEVTSALAADPDNRSLTNLAMMLHRSRGRVLLQSDEMHISGG